MTTTSVSGAVPPVEAELGTWPPVTVVDVDGWAVGLSGGFTRRANSVAATVDVPDVVRAVELAERLYAHAGLRSVFRVCAATRPAGLDALLGARGYVVAARTLLMARGLAPDQGAAAWPSPVPAATLGPHGGRTDGVTVADAPDDAWLRAWLAVKASGAVDLGIARAIVSGAPASYLTAHDDEGPVGVARVAVDRGWAAVSCLMVAPRARRRGVASRLTAAATALADVHGASHAFVQVEEGNPAARSLYERLGFETVAAYHYRELAAR